MTKPVRKADKLPTDAEVARKVQIAFEEIFAPFIVPGPGIKSCPQNDRQRSGIMTDQIQIETPPQAEMSPASKRHPFEMPSQSPD
jgi:hypothetical protein